MTAVPAVSAIITQDKTVAIGDFCLSEIGAAVMRKGGRRCRKCLTGLLERSLFRSKKYASTQFMHAMHQRPLFRPIEWEDRIEVVKGKETSFADGKSKAKKQGMLSERLKYHVLIASLVNSGK